VHAIKVQKIVELRPILKEMGAKKKPPVARPAEAAEFYRNVSCIETILRADHRLLGMQFE
jgi:hypothetical protein